MPTMTYWKYIATKEADKNHPFGMWSEQWSRWGFCILLLGMFMTVVYGGTYIVEQFGFGWFGAFVLAAGGGMLIMGSLAAGGLERYWQKRHDEVMALEIEIVRQW